MPPLKEYIFECISDAQTEIIITTQSNNPPFDRLEFHVKDPRNWKLKTKQQ